MAEAHAIKEGLDLASRMGCSRLIAESDSMEVVAALSGEETCWSEPAAIYADCVDKVVSVGNV
jgi:ribonuclease HI